MPDKLVLTPAWNGLKQQVLHLAQFGGSIQVVQGGAGSGKTTFLKFLATEDFSLPLISLSVNRQVGPESFFLELLQKLGLQVSDSAAFGELIAQLRQYVQSRYSSQARVVVAVDDAHFLGESSIAALISVLQGGTDSGFGLHLIFMSEPGLAETIDSLNLLDITVHDQNLPPLSPSELKELLLEYFSEKPDAPLIGAEEIHSIWVDSKGLPGRALSLARSKYEPLEESISSSRLSFQGLPVAHIAALLVLGLVLSWAFLMRTPDSGVANEGGDINASSRVTSTVDIPQVPATVNRGAEQKSTNGQAEREASKVIPEVDDGKRFEVLASESSPEGDDKHNFGAEPVSNMGEDSDMEGSSLAPKSSDRHQQDSDSSEINNLARSMADKEAQAESSDDSLEPESSPAPKRPFEPQKPSAPEAAAEATGSDSAVANYLIDSKEKILAYSESGFAIQLMALVDLQKLMDFVTAQPNQDSLSVYKAQRNGRQVYILLQGFYKDKQAASEAVKNLPKSQRRAGPWPKSYRSIQSEVAKN